MYNCLLGLGRNFYDSRCEILHFSMSSQRWSYEWKIMGLENEKKMKKRTVYLRLTFYMRGILNLEIKGLPLIDIFSLWITCSHSFVEDKIVSSPSDRETDAYQSSGDFRASILGDSEFSILFADDDFLYWTKAIHWDCCLKTEKMWFVL